MALPHALSGQVIQVQPEPQDLSQFSAIALAKTDELELIRMTLPKGKTMPEHHVPGEITLLCLSGQVLVDIHGEARTLSGGQMLYLVGGQAHALRAEQDSVLLLTILLV
ncbi:cupin domain-containing protein [Janthinobacterium agaricidamnosum]|uniref:Cupin region n=1 Tax=Janthinobacterium agaricidamnosum NBRC 102515 = DSM 9628 TaxID=1349767 RepID=W0VEA7_9BURK|nr:cupin domain-containing protein [Janthinobacterium agaricidamnosum]CDG85672.1 cupin region [Janthinobacterium agaricidamnosum NBRC 102515 = DSM 9628]